LISHGAEIDEKILNIYCSLQDDRIKEDDFVMIRSTKFL